jgi:serine/threonine protein kinase
MQALIADCQITNIVYRSPRTTVYCGVRQSDARPVIVKALTGAYPQPRDLARLRLEFRVARRLKGPGVIDVLALEPWGNNLALVEEHFDGAPLPRPPPPRSI